MVPWTRVARQIRQSRWTGSHVEGDASGWAWVGSDSHALRQRAQEEDQVLRGRGGVGHRERSTVSVISLM